MGSPTYDALQRASSMSANALANMQTDPLREECTMSEVAVIQTRQDVAATFVLQADIHTQLVNISRGVWVVAAVVAIAAFRHGI